MSLVHFASPREMLLEVSVFSFSFSFFIYFEIYGPNMLNEVFKPLTNAVCKCQKR